MVTSWPSTISRSVVVGAPDVDQVIEAALELVAVVGDVG